MNNQEILEYLSLKAGQITWSIEGDKIFGSAMIQGNLAGDTIPFNRFDNKEMMRDILDDIIKGFMLDYDRKTGEIS